MAAKYKIVNQYVKNNEQVPDDQNFYYMYEEAEYKHLRFYVRSKVRDSDLKVTSKAFSFTLNPKRWEYVWGDFIEDEFKFKQ